MEPTRPAAHVDVLIVGAGLSGIGAAYHLQTRCPGKTYAILEGRETMGGTWDLFRYPGIRSDSDMYTLGFSFRPWTNPKAIADGPAILQYLRDTAEAFGIDRKIRYGLRVERARWSSREAKWTVDVRPGLARGWTKRTYPWAQEQPGGALEPLLLPWGGVPNLRYAWDGAKFAVKN